MFCLRLITDMLPNQHSGQTAQRDIIIIIISDWNSLMPVLSNCLFYARHCSGCQKFRKKYYAHWLWGGQSHSMMLWEIMGLFFFFSFLVRVEHLTYLNTSFLESSFISLINTILSWFPYYVSKQNFLKVSNIYYSSIAIRFIFSVAVPLIFVSNLKKLEGEYILSMPAYIHRIFASFGINPRA